MRYFEILNLAPNWVSNEGKSITDYENDFEFEIGQKLLGISKFENLKFFCLQN